MIGGITLIFLNLNLDGLKYVKMEVESDQKDDVIVIPQMDIEYQALVTAMIANGNSCWNHELHSAVGYQPLRMNISGKSPAVGYEALLTSSVKKR